MYELKLALKRNLIRLLPVIVSVVLQIACGAIVLKMLEKQAVFVEIVLRILSVFVCLRICWKSGNTGKQISWVFLILTLPVLGLSMYVFLGKLGLGPAKKKRFRDCEEKRRACLSRQQGVWKQMEDHRILQQMEYIENWGGCPVWENTESRFFKDSSDAVRVQIEALKAAEHFIFLEYYSLEDKQGFAEIREILYEKRKQGVEVRVMYDAMGSIPYVNRKFAAELIRNGISCRIFNPLTPWANGFVHHRDHRKIMVIDGLWAFTGGYNLTEEYFHFTEPYGFWKDTGLGIFGEGARSFTAMFLEMWNAVRETDADWDAYLNVKRPEHSVGFSQSGGGASGCADHTEDCREFVQPYGDSPLDEEPLGENVYLNMLKGAEDFVYLMTPYLIPGAEMERELVLAARRGVDVRIVTPGIPDKKLIFQVTRSFYGKLLDAGVRIFEYTPGFCHGKQWICDGKTAVVGSINLDCRSFYLHFEDAVFLYGSPAIEDIEKDFAEIFPVCKEVRTQKTPFPMQVWQSFLRLFGPLM